MQVPKCWSLHICIQACCILIKTRYPVSSGIQTMSMLFFVDDLVAFIDLQKLSEIVLSWMNNLKKHHEFHVKPPCLPSSCFSA